MNTVEQFTKGIHRVWWVPLITGLVAIALGVWCFCRPEASLSIFGYVFSGCLIFAGCLNIGYSMVNTRLHSNWGWSLVLGILEVICGVWLFSLSPEAMAISFAYAAGIWMLVVAINSIGEATYFSRYGVGWTIWMIILLVATIFFAAYFLFIPFYGGLVGWIWIGVSLLCFGVWRIALAFRLRSFNNKLLKN